MLVDIRLGEKAIVLERLRALTNTADEKMIGIRLLLDYLTLR